MHKSGIEELLEQTYKNFIKEEEQFLKDKENDQNNKLLIDFKLNTQSTTIGQFDFGEPVLKKINKLVEVNLNKKKVNKNKRVF